METPLYLEERSLVKRFSSPLSILLNTLFIMVLFYVSWWIFQDPRGIMRMYTPFVGYMWCRWLLVVMIWIAYIFDFWPFSRSWLNTTHPVLKGVILTTLTAVIFAVMLKLFFETLLGEYAITYFSPERLTKEGLVEFYALAVSLYRVLFYRCFMA